MGVYTFVCRSSGGEWSGKQIADGDLQASAPSTFDLQRKLVQTVLSSDSSGGVQSSFSLVTPSSGVFQVVIGGGSGSGGGFVASSGGGAAAAPAAAAAAPAAEEKKDEPAEESDDDLGLSLFD